MTTAHSRRTALRHFMAAHNLKPTPWCALAGVPESTLRSFLNGKSSALRHDTLEKLARAASAPISQLIGEASPPPNGIYVALKSLAVQAGPDGNIVVVDDETVPPLYWRAEWVKRYLEGKLERGRYLEIIGESLVDGLDEGDIVCVDLTRRSPNRDPGIYCLYDGNDIIVRRLQTLPGREGTVRILSDKARYQSFDLHSGAIQIVGRIIWHAGVI